MEHEDESLHYANNYYTSFLFHASLIITLMD